MKKFLLSATALVGFASLAHAGNTLPQQGLNAGAVSGSTASIGVPTTTTNSPSMPGGFNASVTTNGNAWSQSQLGLSGSTSNSNSSGQITISGGGTLNGAGGGTTMSAQRIDQAYTAAGLTANATLDGNAGLTYSNQTSALSGQTMSAQSTAANGGWSNFSVKTSGSDYSSANLGVPTTTANAWSQGSITGNADQQAGFSATRIDNAASAVNVAGYASGNNLAVAGNLGAEANAGHDLSLSVPTQPQSGNYYYDTPANTYQASISDANSGTSTTTVTAGLGGVGLTSSASSTDSLQGNMPSMTHNNITGPAGTFSGNSAVNAQTDMQLSGSLSGTIPGTGVSGSLSAGGLDGYTNQLNSSN